MTWADGSRGHPLQPSRMTALGVRGMLEMGLCMENLQIFKKLATDSKLDTHGWCQTEISRGFDFGLPACRRTSREGEAGASQATLPGALTPWIGGSRIGPSASHGERGWWQPGDSATHPRRYCLPEDTGRRVLGPGRQAPCPSSPGGGQYLVPGDLMGHQLLEQVEVHRVAGLGSAGLRCSLQQGRHGGEERPPSPEQPAPRRQATGRALLPAPHLPACE